MPPEIPVPTETDWRSEAWGPDAEYAYEMLNGKNYVETMQMFRDHAIARQEDVMFMPDRCFPFFFNIYMDYLLSPDSAEDSDAASCFFSLVEFKHSEIKSMDQWLIEKTTTTIARLGENQSFYDAETDIYGSFSDRAAKTLQCLA